MKNTFMLMMSMVMMLTIGVVSCSKDDNEEEQDVDPDVAAKMELTIGIWQQTESGAVGPYRVVYYDVYGEDGSLREYLVWLDEETFKACSYMDYNWKIEGGIYYKKAAEADGYGPGERCLVDGGKFYLGKESHLAAERVEMTAEMEGWFETAFKED